MMNKRFTINLEDEYISNTNNSNKIFPSTRYQGSKLKISDWIMTIIKDLNFNTCLDAFGGSGCISYGLKKLNKSVTYNDILKFNYLFGKALIENNEVRLSKSDISYILKKHDEIEYPTVIEDNFKDIYFTDDENKWLDQTITNIYSLKDEYKYSLAFFALSQACIIKRPYNLFHRKNLYMRTSNVKRSFGNKITWDRPFDEYFIKFSKEANESIFDNGKDNVAKNEDAIGMDNNYDLVYIDTPYISEKGTTVDYHAFYHFLEGLTDYNNWERNIDFKYKHNRLKPIKNPWNNKKSVHRCFNDLFGNFEDSKIVVSYRSDGIPSENQLKSILEQYKSKVEIYYYGNYKYALSKNSNSKEILLVGV